MTWAYVSWLPEDAPTRDLLLLDILIFVKIEKEYVFEAWNASAEGTCLR